jgi:hypothetical protein
MTFIPELNIRFGNDKLKTIDYLAIMYNVQTHYQESGIHQSSRII